MRVSVDDLTEIHRLPPEMETALFRVVQEAVSISPAMLRHEMSGLNFSTERDVRLEVEDDGVGFDGGNLSLEPDSLRGIGLLGMQERLELLGGELEIHTARQWHNVVDSGSLSRRGA